MECNLGSLVARERSFHRAGWFIPPYIQMGVLSRLAADINARWIQFDQDELERTLAQFYDPAGLAAMVMYRYPFVPIIKNYRETIAEAIEAHFFGLNHVAIGGLVPVIEGAGRQFAAERNITDKGIRSVFAALANDCKQESASRNIGAFEEIESMMDSFIAFVRDYLYVDSSMYPLADKTNRHGITHGAYADADYGRPLNFYKAIAAIDFLTFVAGLRTPMSAFAPDYTDDSLRLAAYYESLQKLSAERVL